MITVCWHSCCVRAAVWFASRMVANCLNSVRGDCCVMRSRGRGWKLTLRYSGKSSTCGSRVLKRVSAIAPDDTSWHRTNASTAPFAGGLWKIHVELPDQYPYKSPSIGFINRIFHPNIDELYGRAPTQLRAVDADNSARRSGSVCLDVINQTWSPMYDMINIFEVFLPQLLRYPNPTDPLNGEAAALMMRDQKSYDAKVKGELCLLGRRYTVGRKDRVRC